MMQGGITVRNFGRSRESPAKRGPELGGRLFDSLRGTKIYRANFMHAMATVCAQQVTHLFAEAQIIKLKATDVLGVLVFNNQKASIRLTLRDLYFYKRAAFSLWVFIHVSIYPHPRGRPVGTSAIRHAWMGAQIHHGYIPIVSYRVRRGSK